MSALSELATFVGDGAHWTGNRGIPHRSFEHLRLALGSVAVAAALAGPPAAWLGHIGKGGVVVQWLVNVGRAIPSLALLALLFPLSLRYGFGLGYWPTFVALIPLAIPPIFVNTYAAVRGVPAELVEASLGMGMRPIQVLTRVELPSSLPLVLTGLRIATLQVVATATLGAYVGFNGLGSFITEGFSQQDQGKLLTGAISVAAVALLVDALLGLLIRRATPWRPTKGLTP